MTTSFPQTRTGLLLVVAAVAASVTGLQGVQDAGHADTLHRLQSATGWIFVADVDPLTDLWLSQPKHILKSREATKAPVPVPGDFLELTAPSQLVIRGYAETLELNRLACPVGAPIERSDIVGRLPIGMVLEVKEVCRERVIQGLQGIWARVVAAEAR